MKGVRSVPSRDLVILNFFSLCGQRGEEGRIKKANFKLLNQCKNAEIAISKLPEKSKAEKNCDIPNRENVRVRIFGGLIALILFSRDPSDFFFDLAEKM